MRLINSHVDAVDEMKVTKALRAVTGNDVSVVTNTLMM